MTMSLGAFIAMIVVSIAGAAVLMVLLLLSFLKEFKENEVW